MHKGVEACSRNQEYILSRTEVQSWLLTMQAAVSPADLLYQDCPVPVTYNTQHYSLCYTMCLITKTILLFLTINCNTIIIQAIPTGQKT